MRTAAAQRSPFKYPGSLQPLSKGGRVSPGRGDLICVGTIVPMPHRDSGCRGYRILFALLLFAVWTVMFIGVWSVGGFTLSSALTYVATMAVWIFVVQLAGIEAYAIYERGVTSFDAVLTDSLTHRGFQAFGEVSVIGETRDPKGIEGLLLFAGPERKLRIAPIWKRWSTPTFESFYANLKAVLRERCPSARWVHVPFDGKSLYRRKMTWREARRRPPSPSQRDGDE